MRVERNFAFRKMIDAALIYRVAIVVPVAVERMRRTAEGDGQVNVAFVAVGDLEGGSLIAS